MKKKRLIKYIPAVITCLFICLLSCSKEQSMPLQLKIDKDKLADKIKGGWAGKTIGCTYGGPVEFVYNGTFIHDYAPIDWEDGKIKWYYDNFPGLYDDLYVNITFVDVFERLGLTAPADSFAMAFANAGYPLWHANQVARSNIAQGILPPASGYWQNNPHADDIDYQIEADFAGLMSPAMPNTASEISDKIGHIITYGDGWYGGVFTGAMYSLAFVYDDAATVVCEALKTIPSQSDFYQCIADVICWHKANPEDWKQAWFECEKKWASEIGCPDGVFLPFNIDAKINSAYVVIGLLYGKGNFYRTMDIAARCGQDADCNAATAAGVLGTLLGYSQIPETWKKNLYEVENLNFAYTTISLNKLYELSLKQALQVVEQQGGSIDGNTVAIKSQKPQSVKYEKSFEEHYPVKKQSVHRNITQNPNLSFGGIGIVVKGYVQSPNPNYIANVEVVLDGKRDSLYLPVATSLSIDKRKVDLYWKYQLPENKHEIRFKWLNPQKDAMVYFTEAIVYSR